MAKITIKDLMEAGVHFGHQTKRWNPKMKDYVFGAKNGIYIIDLTKTMRQIAEASNFLQRRVMDGGEILFVGTKRQSQEVVKEAAEKTGMFHVTERWLGGTLTNNTTIQKSVSRMLEADKIIANPEASLMKKKEISSLSRDNRKLHKNLDGIVKMKKLPAALIVVDICKEEIAVREARKLKIPVVAIVDTNADIDAVDYPIVANDDAVRSIKIIVDVLGESISYALEIYSKFAAERQAAAEASKAARDAEAKERKDSAPRKERAPRRGGPRRDEGGQGRRPQAPRDADKKPEAAKAVAAPAKESVPAEAAPVAAKVAEVAVAKEEPKAAKAKVAAPAKEAASAVKPAKAEKPKAKKIEAKKQDKPVEKKAK
ncbi:MAG: 30S ribosomal protein S2 [Lentisphaerae bacterium]|nr:30S ribosomal protein S2 [Lentisphaerota bacterium]